MKRAVPILASLLLLVTRAGAENLLDEAEQAYRTGVPEVTVAKLERYLAGPHDVATDARARILCGRCLIETSKFEAALEILGQLPEAVRDTGEVQTLQGQAYLRQQRWERAAEVFQSLLQQSPPQFQGEARLGLAQAQRGLNQLDNALGTLKPLQSSEPLAGLLAAEIELQRGNSNNARLLLEKLTALDTRLQTRRDCLLAECDLTEHRLDQAEAAFNAVLASSQGSPRVRAIAQIGLAHVGILRQETEEAEEALEKLISDDPNNPLLGSLFKALFTIYSQETNPSLNEWLAWAEDGTDAADRLGYARYYLARLYLQQASREKALSLLKLLLLQQPRHPIAQEAAATLGRELARNGSAAQAIDVLETFRTAADLTPDTLSPSLAFVLARVYYLTGKITAAHQIFATIKSSDLDIEKRALFNSALCSRQLGQQHAYDTEVAALQKLPQSETFIGALLFDRALLQARAGQSQADQTFSQFIREYPKDSKLADAHLILAELHLTQQPADPQSAESELDKVQSSDPALREKADHLKFVLAVSDPKQKAPVVEQLAKEFLEKYPQSPFRAEIHLRLGEFFFRENDFANSQTQFELVREEDPDSPLLEPALFLAGEAARKSLNPSSLDNAITLFEDVYKLGGPLKFQARLEQALAKRQVHQENEAIVLLEDLLTQRPPDEVRYQALEEIGEAKFTMASSQPELYQQAVEAFDRLASLENLPPEWKQRALYKKAQCYEKQHKLDAALETYYDIISIPAANSDQLWFFRAGFGAAQILEDRHAWSSAAAIYDRLASSRGARSEEAKDRLDRLRLEHFLWPE